MIDQVKFRRYFLALGVGLCVVLLNQQCQLNNMGTVDGESLSKDKLLPSSASPGVGIGTSSVASSGESGGIIVGGALGPSGDGQGFEGKLEYVAKQTDFCEQEKSPTLKDIVNVAERVGANLLLTRKNCQAIAPERINEEAITSSLATPKILGIGGAPFESLSSSQEAENKDSFIVTRCAGRYIKNGVTLALVDGVVRATPKPGKSAASKDGFTYVGQFYILRPKGVKNFSELINLTDLEIEKVTERINLPLVLNLEPKCPTYCEGNRRFGQDIAWDPEKATFRIDLLSEKWRYTDMEKRRINGRVFVPTEDIKTNIGLPAHCELAPTFLPLKGFLDE